MTERLVQPTQEYGAYWINDHPPSGLFAHEYDARGHLMAILPQAQEMVDVEPCTFELNVGPYPEPVRRTSD